jgi:putative restriction endonuclease
MRIALRPSGGRGDYELAGSYNRLHASDLLEKRFFFQLTPAITVDGRSAAHRLAGKPRIRPEEGKHAYILLSSLLLLPPPRRELEKTPNALPRLRTATYTIAGIDVDVLEDKARTVTFSPTTIWAKTRGGLLRVDYAERMAVIAAIWAAADGKRSDLAGFVKEHRSSAVSGDHDRIVNSAKTIQRHFQTDDDVIHLILSAFELPDAKSAAYAGISDSTAGFESEDDTSSPEDSRRERARKWRKQADRGPGARDFSLNVRDAYNYRCLFSGERFPKLPHFDSAGVDGAHILPWSTHQLNSVSNGICLCKLCHWAFDNGLLRLDFDPGQNEYLLSIPRDIEEAAIGAKFDLPRFRPNLGRIERSRLPTNQRLWPSPKHIQEYNDNL